MSISLVLGFAFFAIAIAGMLVIVQTARKSARKTARYRPQASRHESPPPKDSPKYKQLLGMVNGDRRIADNLARAYGVEKAIEDLIRDRR